MLKKAECACSQAGKLEGSLAIGAAAIKHSFVRSMLVLDICREAQEEFLQSVLLGLFTQVAIGNTAIDPVTTEARNEFVRLVTGIEQQLISEYDRLVSLCENSGATVQKAKEFHAKVADVINGGNF